MLTGGLGAVSASHRQAIGVSERIDFLTDGAVHELLVAYDARTQLLVIDVDSHRVLEVQTDFPSLVPLSGTTLAAHWLQRSGTAKYAYDVRVARSSDGGETWSMVAETTRDSLGGSNPYTAFIVEARSSTSISADRWYSAPDSGYSVDNLAPAAPAPFTGTYSGGASVLHWNPNAEADLAGYRLYRGTSASFSP